MAATIADMELDEPWICPDGLRFCDAKAHRLHRPFQDVLAGAELWTLWEAFDPEFNLEALQDLCRNLTFLHRTTVAAVVAQLWGVGSDRVEHIDALRASALGDLSGRWLMTAAATVAATASSVDEALRIVEIAAAADQPAKIWSIGAVSLSAGMDEVIRTFGGLDAVRFRVVARVLNVAAGPSPAAFEVAASKVRRHARILSRLPAEDLDVADALAGGWTGTVDELYATVIRLR